MTMEVRYLSVLIILLYLSPIRNAFNVDVNAPIIKTGVRNSYFGFSAAVHWIKTENSHYILVGAPLQNVSGFTQPGAVFKCPLTSQLNDCTEVELIYSSAANHAHQWMGVAIASQSRTRDESRAVICAHRYMNRDKDYVEVMNGPGVCITLTNDLSEETYLEPCAAGISSSHQGRGLCQAGTSVAVNDDDNIVVGAPGTTHWHGSLEKTDFPSMSPDADDDQWYQTDSDMNSPGRVTELGAYLGMSVKFGRQLENRTTLVGGAPRSRGHGQVFLFELQHSDKKIIPRLSLDGEQTGSAFGYDTAVGDFNGDGKDDLVVGAPFYFKRGVGGAIYIYVSGSRGIEKSNKHRIDSRSMKPDECEKFDCTNARFGFSLANAGDLDKDGFQDLVVGAPYEGFGAVYIFHGSKQQSASSVLRLSQRIYASDIARAPGLRTFGYSFADTRGADIDRNEYPDVVVGAYASDSAIALRTQPVINVISTFNSNPEKVNSQGQTCFDGSPYNCFNISACLRFTAEPKARFQKTLTLQYRLVADHLTDAKISRVSFKSKQSSPENNIIYGNITLHEQAKQTDSCIREIVYINKNNRDILRSITFELTYSLSPNPVPVMKTNGPLLDLNVYPVLRPRLTPPTFAVPFVKNCGQDDACLSQLSLDVSVSDFPTDDQGRFVVHVGQMNHLALDISVINSGEDAHEATLTVQLPSNMVFSESDDAAKQYSCTYDSSTNCVGCRLGNPLVPNKKISLQLVLSPDIEISFDENSNDVIIFLNTTSTERTTSDDVRILQLVFVYGTDLAVLGSSNPVSVMCKNEIQDEQPQLIREIGPEVKHIYEVRNNGPLAMPSSELEINWPFRWRGSESSYILYLIKEPQMNELFVSCSYDRQIINRQNFKTENEQDESEDGMELVSSFTSSSQLRMRRSTSSMDCGDDRIECASFFCTIDNLEPGNSAVIVFTARLWNRTISEKFQDEEEVIIFSTARLRTNSKQIVRQTNPANDLYQAKTNVYFEGVQKGLRIWHIILAIAIGLLVLIALIILLWKCGFFKRNKVDQVQYRAEVRRQSKRDEVETKVEQSSEQMLKQ